MSTETLEKPKAKPPLKQAPEPGLSPANPFDIDKLQAYVDSVAVEVNLPTVKPGIHPMETFKASDGSILKRIRRACKSDDNGNPIPMSGPVVTEPYVEHLWKIVTEIVGNDIQKTAWRMSESILIPERNGEPDNRSRVLQKPEGR